MIFAFTLILIIYSVICSFDIDDYYSKRIRIENSTTNEFYRIYSIKAESESSSLSKLRQFFPECFINDCSRNNSNCELLKSETDDRVLWKTNKCLCFSSNCDTNSKFENSTILFPGCTCGTKSICEFSEQCDFWKMESDNSNMTFDIFPTKKNLLFKSFIQTGWENGNFSNSVASLVSTVFRQSGINCTLRFYHHLSSQSDTSRVVVKIKSGNEIREIWEKRNQDMRYWVEERIRIGSFSKPFRITIDCESGSNPKVNNYNRVFACGLAAIDFDQCQEIGNPLESCSTSDITICSSNNNVNCLNDVECDMKTDCSNGIDESNCDSIPRGARCDFNDLSSFCDGWHQVTRIAQGQDFDERMSSSPTVAPINKLPDEPVYLLRIRQPGPRYSVHREARNGSGSVLMYEASDAAKMKLSARISALVSPVFPRTNPEAYNISSRQFGACKLRFFVCAKTLITKWQIAIISKTSFVFESGKRVIFFSHYPDSSTFKRECEWIRHLIPIPRQNREYRLAIFVENGYDRKDYFAIDDFSLSPDCFEKDAGNSSDFAIPDILVNSCGATGSHYPISCSKYRDLDGQTDHFLKERGAQEWTVPSDGFYRIEMCGAGGGSSRSENGSAGQCALFQVHLLENLALRMLIGQMGEYACHQDAESDSELLSRGTCKGFPGENRSSRYPGGGGGGGATLLTAHHDDWDAVAAGGAGASDGSRNGTVFVAGYGSSVIQVDMDLKCKRICRASSTRSFFNDRRPNICVSGRRNPVLGGFGGGGNSCGLTGGGGAGYRAGRPSESGSSFVNSNFSKTAHYFQSIDISDGYIRIGLCRLNCPSPSLCRFRGKNLTEQFCSCPDGNDFVDKCECSLTCPYSSKCVYRNFTFDPFCECLNGKVIKNILVDRCEEISNSWMFSLLLGSIAFITALVAFMLVRHYKMRNEKMAKELIEFNTLKSVEFLYDETYFGNQTRQEAMENLPTINREFLKIGGPLGKGNFGEVLKGSYSIGGEVYNVAVKVISRQYSASHAAQSNFCNEALCMGTFVHENIVKLLGINFDEPPLMIVSELMEGGDLLAFMKSSRPTLYSINPNNLNMMDLIQICFDVSCGCKCLEDFGYVHRDIAARNVLITKKGAGRVAKIADFGLAKEITYGSEYYRMHGRTMLPIKWTPPEAFTDGVFTTKSDVWSYGVFCWEVFSLGVTPYPNQKNEEVMLIITEGQRLSPPYGIPVVVYELMRNCWKTATDGRYSFAQIVKKFEEINEDLSVTSREFPVHPNMKNKMSNSPFTPTSCDTPKTPVTATTLLSNDSPRFSEPLIRTILTKEENDEKEILFKMKLEREPPYITDMSKKLVEELKNDLINMKEEDDILNIMQPDLSSLEISEISKLIPDGSTAESSSSLDINKLAVQDTGPTLHRPDSLNISPYVPLTKC